MFILILQFIWKYIDDLLGKGLGTGTILELLLYTSATLIPMALPLSILLASLMTFGNLGEKSELVIMKAAGLSLRRILAPLIVFVSIISFGAFLFSNYLLPRAKLEMGSLLYDIRRQKPGLNLRPNQFYTELENISIRIGGKEIRDDGDILKDILISDFREDKGDRKFIRAKYGTMSISNDNHWMIFDLHEGYSYEETHENNREKIYPFKRQQFDRNTIRIDISSLKLERTDKELFEGNYQLLDVKGLSLAIDTLSYLDSVKRKKFEDDMHGQYSYFTNPVKSDSVIPMAQVFENASIRDKQRVFKYALNSLRSKINRLNTGDVDLSFGEENIVRHEIEFHRKFTLPLACIVLFFIGAPLGSIIKKGGLGWPTVISVLFFVLYYVLSITGEKMAQELVIEVYEGMWLSTAILLPLGIFLTYKAATDSSLFTFNLDQLSVLLIWKRKKKD